VAPPGHGVCVPFGDYWVVPDNTNQSYGGVTGEQITESEFHKAEQTWSALQSGSGGVVISESDDDGVDHGGFKASVLTRFGQLMSAPVGRQLVEGLVASSKTVTIRPTSKNAYGGMKAGRGEGSKILPGGKANVGGTSTIQIDPGLGDTDLRVYDKDHHEIAEPLYIGLGHELIHASHNQAGTNTRDLPAKGPHKDISDNLEEETTIEGGDGGPSENALRAEHGLPARVGHGGVDLRPEMVKWLADEKKKRAAAKHKKKKKKAQ
jgi:hypothetical protein